MFLKLASRLTGKRFVNKVYGQLTEAAYQGLFFRVYKMDSLQLDIANEAFKMGFDYGKTWFILYLIVILGIFITKTVGKL